MTNTVAIKSMQVITLLHIVHQKIELHIRSLYLGAHVKDTSLFPHGLRRHRHEHYISVFEAKLQQGWV